MAEGAFIRVVEGVIDKSGSLADQIGLLSGVKDDLEKLRNACLVIQAVILDAEEQQLHNHQIGHWVRRLKDVVFEADNLLDAFSSEALEREGMTHIKKMKKVRVFFSKFNQLAHRLKWAHKIKAIREKIDDVALDRTHFHLGLRPVETEVRNRTRETHDFVSSEEVIGRENDKKAIIGTLLDPNVEENVAVLPIVGIGGSGKTTLAQLVFNDEVIRNHFEIRLWVCVSDDFDIKTIVENILKSAKGERKENLEINTVINDLHQEIDGKRYILVLDDVWNYDRGEWDDLKTLLSKGASGSRILVTTREEKVARITQTIEPYFLRGLDNHDSWSLLKKMAFENGREPEELRFKKIGMEIVENCKGVPLAIKNIGTMLYLKSSEKEWWCLRNIAFSELSLGGNDILQTLRLSYDHLPSYLKQCFAYCSLFPKDYGIEKEKLIKLWMAEGFIKLSGPNQNLEDVGHEYFMELLSRSFFHKVEENQCGNVSFKIHDLMHDLLTSVTRQESTIFGINGEHIDVKTRHLSFGFHLGSSSLTTALFQTSSLKTFLLCGQQSGELENGLNESNCDAIISHFKFLRVLDLHKTGIKTIPSSITKLNHLRYLDLSDNKLIKMLPKSLSRLQYLQTLKLSGCVQLIELPTDISKLVNLRSLEIDGCRDLTHLPCGLGQLTNLQTLSQFVMSKDTCSVSGNNGELVEVDRLKGELKELNTLNNLRGTLDIVNLRHGEDAEAESKATNLRGMEHLQALGLRWIEDEVDEADVVFDEASLEALQPHPNLRLLSLSRYGGVKFPTWLSSLTNLIELALFGCKKWQHLSQLYKIPSLKVLEIDSLPDLEYISHSEESSNTSLLPSLEELKLKYCPNLKGWWQRRRDSIEEVNDDDGNFGGVTTTTTTTSMLENHLPPSFSRLSKLCIRGCPQLISLPLFPFLEKLELYYCSFKPLEETAKMEVATAVASTSSSSTNVTSSFGPLSKLKSLEIGRMEQPLPEGCMQNLKSLDRLWIYECCGPLLQGMRHLASLKQLDICSSEVFDLSNDGNNMEWQGLNSLSSLWLFQLSKLKSLPVGIQHITSLRKLRIDYCPCLMELPEWISSLTSLEILEILQCPKLRSLPAGISCLTSLHTLKIRDCPILLQRYKNETCNDWHKIAHIPNLCLEDENTDGEPNAQQKKLDVLRIRA